MSNPLVAPQSAQQSNRLLRHRIFEHCDLRPRIRQLTFKLNNVRFRRLERLRQSRDPAEDHLGQLNLLAPDLLQTA